jgi:hypothetical protein
MVNAADFSPDHYAKWALEVKLMIKDRGLFAHGKEIGLRNRCQRLYRVFDMFVD